MQPAVSGIEKDPCAALFPESYHCFFTKHQFAAIHVSSNNDIITKKKDFGRKQLEMAATTRAQGRKRTRSENATKPNATADGPLTIPDEAFAISELPAELRNTIYMYAARDDNSARINKRKPGGLSTTSGFSMINKQIREEYISALYLHAPKFTAVVKDFDFRHIATFFNKLSYMELDASESKSSISAKRRISIHLTFSPTCSPCPGDLYLERWLKRLEHPTKKSNKSQYYLLY